MYSHYIRLVHWKVSFTLRCPLAMSAHNTFVSSGGRFSEAFRKVATVIGRSSGNGFIRNIVLCKSSLQLVHIHV